MEKETLYTIQEVAFKLGRSVHTIGRWQREGHVHPRYETKPGGGMIRIFTEEDIEILEEVKKQKLDIMLSGTGEGGVITDDKQSASRTAEANSEFGLYGSTDD